jgi:ribonuclease HI
LKPEETAVLRYTELLLPKNEKRRRVTTSESALVWDSMQALEKLIGSNKVTLMRVPGRHGIPGKEEADKSVKEGTN